MPDIVSVYTPEEAFAELIRRRRAYYDKYGAVFSGLHSELKQTGEPGSFWKRCGKARVHIPVAADIASTSANMLFGEEPRFSVYDSVKGETEEGSLARMNEIIKENSLISKLHEAAESGAAYGDVYLKCRYDKENAEAPMIHVVSGADALPEYSLGKIRCIHFFTVFRYDAKTGKQWRVYERYEPGRIVTGVYCGTSSSLGTYEPGAVEMLGLQEETTPPVDMLLAAHIVNMKPSRVWMTDDKGRSDFEGLRDMMDSMDEIYTSWLRDIRLAKSRLIVPAEYLRRKSSDLFKEGQYTYEFDEDVETLVALDITNDANMQITPSQFSIRSTEHAATYESTLRTIISMAGYSPQTFGLDIEGAAQSGTARRIMEKKSLSTNAKKQNYWKAPLENFLTAVMQLDKALYGNPAFGDEDSVRVELRDPIATDTTDIAGAVNMLRSAQAASTETLVKMLHPDWTQAQVDEEVKAVHAESGIESISPVPELGDLE